MAMIERDGKRETVQHLFTCVCATDCVCICQQTGDIDFFTCVQCEAYVISSVRFSYKPNITSNGKAHGSRKLNRLRFYGACGAIRTLLIAHVFML